MKYFKHPALILCTLIVMLGFQSNGHSATVKSIYRVTKVEIDGAQAEQHRILCSNRQERVITKLRSDKRWCYGEDRNVCSSDKLQAAKRVCNRRSNNTVDTSANEKNAVSKGAASPEAPRAAQSTAASVNSAKREILQAELQQVTSDQESIKTKIDQLEQQRKDLLERHKEL